MNGSFCDGGHDGEHVVNGIAEVDAEEDSAVTAILFKLLPSLDDVHKIFPGSHSWFND